MFWGARDPQASLAEIDISDNDIPNEEMVTFLQSMHENKTVKKLIMDRSFGGKKADRDTVVSTHGRHLLCPSLLFFLSGFMRRCGSNPTLANVR